MGNSLCETKTNKIEKDSNRPHADELLPDKLKCLGCLENWFHLNMYHAFSFQILPPNMREELQSYSQSDIVSSLSLLLQHSSLCLDPLSSPETIAGLPNNWPQTLVFILEWLILTCPFIQQRKQQGVKFKNIPLDQETDPLLSFLIQLMNELTFKNKSVSFNRLRLFILQEFRNVNDQQFNEKAEFWSTNYQSSSNNNSPQSSIISNDAKHSKQKDKGNMQRSLSSLLNEQLEQVKEETKCFMQIQKESPTTSATNSSTNETLSLPPPSVPSITKIFPELRQQAEIDS